MLPLTRFKNFSEQYALFEPSDAILLAVSGGRDSVLMAHLFAQSNFTIGIAHCNFNLRPVEAMRDQEFTAELAKTLGAPFYLGSFETQNYAAKHGISIQMAARTLRYQWFEQIRESFGYSFIALAQHQNDAVETILLNLTRGTGIAGMHGILPKTNLLIRPLLFLSRAEIDDITAAEKMAFVEDSSNTSVKYARNKIRLKVIPVLQELNPSLEETFDHNLRRFRELEQLLHQNIKNIKHQLFKKNGEDIGIDIAAVKLLQPRRLLLYGLLSPYGFNETSIDDLILALDKHPGRTFQSAAYKLTVDREQLILSKQTNKMLHALLIEEDTKAVSFGAYRLSLLHDDTPLVIKDNPMAASADASKLKFPLTLRIWAEGDYFFPLGMKGRKKLSDYFVNEKIPVHLKKEIPILVNGNDEVIWVGGYRLDNRYKVDAHTKKVVIFELNKQTQ